MKYNKWHLWIGFIIGAVAPLITFFIIYYSVFEYQSWTNPLKAAHSVIRPFVQLSVITNLALFFLFLMFNMERLCRGILFATILYGLYVLYITFY